MPTNVTNVYVKTSGNDSNDGTSWETAKRTIQAGILIVNANGNIWVDDGTYYENIIIGSSLNISIKSKNNNPETTIIDGGGMSRCVTTSFGSHLFGFTITNGYSSGGGGARNITLHNCIIHGNYSPDFGGGCYNSDMYNCLLYGNTALEGGGAVNGNLYNCIVADNVAYNAYGGLGGSNVYNCISWNNNKVDGVIAVQYYSCGVGYTGTGCITIDPLFIGGDDYRLQASSPCIDSGINQEWMDGDVDLDNNMRIYPEGGTVDMGAYEFGSVPYPSSSSISSISTSSISSSSSQVPSKKTTYLSNCKSPLSITTPMAGINANMCYFGSFDTSDPTTVTEHIEIGGLVNNKINKGIIYCPNANKLFYMKAGGVSLTMSLPYNIENGIYDEVKGSTESLIKDKLIWGVNLGDAYITSPGLYASLTPYGIEFTIWSSLSKASIVDVSTSVLANTDFTIDFAWNKNGVLEDIPSANMAIFVNGELTSWGSCLIGNDSFDSIYKYSNGDSKSAGFCLMGNKSRLLSLEGTLRRIETYTSRSFFASSSEPSSSSISYVIKKSNISLPISFYGVREPIVKIKDIVFNTVITKDIDIGLSQESGAFRNKFGNDDGVEINPNIVLPEPPIDLPPGFEIVRRV